MNSILQGVTDLLGNPLFWKIIVAYYVFNAVASSLPQPGANKVYQFAYRFIHAFAGNLDRLASAVKVPGADGKNGAGTT